MLDSFIAFVNGMIAVIPGQEWTAAGIVAGAIEFILRLWKSEKPLSILHGVAASLRSLSLLFAKAADLLDRILPQRLA